MLAIGVALHAAAGDQAALTRGVTALHSFEYEDANDAFAQARQLNPGLVMAYWGEAMSYHQTLWRNENVQAARDALARLGPTRPARLAKASDPKEQGYLTAVESLFGDGDADTFGGSATRTRWRGCMRSIPTTPTSHRSMRSACSARCRAV